MRMEAFTPASHLFTLGHCCEAPMKLLGTACREMRSSSEALCSACEGSVKPSILRVISTRSGEVY